MTIQESTICGLVQSFPILLILAQNNNKCLKTPFVYKPPSPTPSPEYYEALEALFQNLFGHGYHGNEHHGCGYGHIYGYGKKLTHGNYASLPCHTFTQPTGHDFSHYGHGTYNSHSYPGTVYPSTLYPGTVSPGTVYHGYRGYPAYGYKKISVYNVSGSQGYKGTYAPTQVYNMNHKYKIVVKKNKKGRPHRPHKLQELQISPEECEWEGKSGYCVVIDQCDLYLNTVNKLKSLSSRDINLTRSLYHFMASSKCSLEETEGLMVCCPSELSTLQLTEEIEANISLESLHESRDKDVTDPVTKKICEWKGRNGNCVPIDECKSYINSLTKQNNKSSTVFCFINTAKCDSQEAKDYKVCCPRSKELLSDSDQPEFNLSRSIEVSGNLEVDASSGSHVNNSSYVDSLPEPPYCGGGKFQMKIVGGRNAKLGNYPWMAVLGYLQSSGSGENILWDCGGSLISKRHVLTASHCLDRDYWSPNRLYLVRFGELDTSKEEETPPPVDIAIDRLILHPDYSPTQNDIGILVLTQQVQFTDFIKPICLPRSKELRSRTFEKQSAIVAGWGDKQYRGDQASLQAVQLTVISNNRCARAYANVKDVTISEQVLCAGALQGAKITCRGDSGGSLIQPIRHKKLKKFFYYQIGVVSQGYGCILPGKPGIHSRVTEFIPWIEQQVLNHVEDNNK